MGKGDKKTRKGKIAKRSYGNKRSHDATAAKGAATGTPKVAAVRKPVVSRPAAAPARKAAAPSKTAGTARKAPAATRKPS